MKKLIVFSALVSLTFPARAEQAENIRLWNLSRNIWERPAPNPQRPLPVVLSQRVFAHSQAAHFTAGRAPSRYIPMPSFRIIARGLHRLLPVRGASWLRPAAGIGLAATALFTSGCSAIFGKGKYKASKEPLSPNVSKNPSASIQIQADAKEIGMARTSLEQAATELEANLSKLTSPQYTQEQIAALSSAVWSEVSSLTSALGQIQTTAITPLLKADKNLKALIESVLGRLNDTSMNNSFKQLVHHPALKGYMKARGHLRNSLELKGINVESQEEITVLIREAEAAQSAIVAYGDTTSSANETAIRQSAELLYQKILAAAARNPSRDQKRILISLLKWGGNTYINFSDTGYHYTRESEHRLATRYETGYSTRGMRVFDHNKRWGDDPNCKRLWDE